MNSGQNVIRLPSTPKLDAIYVVREHLPFQSEAGEQPRYAEYSIECAAGRAPRMTLHAWNLTLDETTYVRERIAARLLMLRILCRCGVPWFEHASSSPHAAPIGDCRSFTAASPLAGEHEE